MRIAKRPLVTQRRLILVLAPLGVMLLLVAGIAVYHPFGARAVTPQGLTDEQERLLSGFAALEFGSTGSPELGSQKPTNFFPRGDDGCSLTLHDDVKVNQNCQNVTDPNLQGRGQANNETAIAQDPNHPKHLIASDNDYRRGDGNCYSSYSLDGGLSWTDSTVPMGFTNGATFGAAREYWQAGGDTSVAWDTKGNAYLDCQVFLRGAGVSPNPDQSSAVYVFRSTGNFGASWNFPGRPVVEFNDVAGTGCCLEDKPYMTVDNHVGSPFQDRIYVTWTEFAADGSAYIWESYSSDYGEHFSARHLVSMTSSLCTITFGAGTPHGNCNENQFSDPFTGSDGNLYVAFNNFNNAVTGADNRNQVLLAKSTDGGATFGSPVKVADYYDLPDCATYQAGQDFGRACVPEKGSATNSVFRATNYPSGAVDPTNSSRVAVTFGSYINVNSNESNGCAPNGFAASGNNAYTGVKTPGACNNKILLSVSTNGGASFTGTATDPRTLTTVTQDPSQATTDQWWQWAAFTTNGKLAVSYYDRQYGSDETTGSMDFTLSGSKNLATFKSTRVTGSSMPLPTQFPDAQGNSVFFGDYTGLSAVTQGHPIWMDTRLPELFLCPGGGAPTICRATEPTGIQANDQEIFTQTEEVP